MMNVEQRIAALEARCEANEDDLLTIGAAVSALRFLLEQAYGNAFMGREAEFLEFMAVAMERTRVASRPSDPNADPELMLEHTAQSLAWLQRFRDSVARGLRAGFFNNV